MAKKELMLLSNVDNVIDLPQSTINNYIISEDDKGKIVDSMRMFLNKMEGNFSYKILKKHQDNNFERFEFATPPKYPLPTTFNTRTKKIIINMSIWGRKDIINIDARDMYATLLYGYTSALYTVKPLNNYYVDDICNYMASLFLKIPSFAKKYGLIGSFANEIPKLIFLVDTYVLTSFFEMGRTQAYNKASKLSETTKDTFTVDLNDYDFYNIRDFIRCLSESGVMPFKGGYAEFVSSILSRFGILNIAMFEDGMRFLSTVAGSTINSNSLYPPTLRKYNYKLYDSIARRLKDSLT